MKHKYLILCVLPILLGFGAGNAANYTILHDARDQKMVPRIRRITDSALRSLEDKYQLVPDSFTVIIAPDKASFNAHVSKDFPFWGVAAAKYSDHQIILQSMRINRQPLNEFEQTIVHELVHIALEPLVRDRWFPRWINEGLAQYEAGQFSLRSKALLGQRAYGNDYIPLNKIDDVLKFDQTKANLAYAESVSAVNWLLDEFGNVSFQHFLTNLAAGQECDTAFYNAYEFSIPLFELSWAKWAKRRYKPFALLELPNLLWTLMPLLVLAGWLRVKLKNRNIEAHWRRQDEWKKFDA